MYLYDVGSEMVKYSDLIILLPYYLLIRHRELHSCD